MTQPLFPADINGVALHATSVTTLYGDTIGLSSGGTFTGTVDGVALLHTWTADGDGLFHTATDLNAEWQGYYAILHSNDAAAIAALTPIERLEANAQAVFLNTGLSRLDAATQERDREDVQREYDAIDAAMRIDQASLGIDPKAALTVNAYVSIERTIQATPMLQELSLQGHGLNAPPAPKYAGYTNDFQNGVDGTTLFIGGGLDNNQNALTAFFDDVVLSHEPFSVVHQGDVLEQLNQNGNAEDPVTTAAIALDDAMYGRVFGVGDFSATASTANDAFVSSYFGYVNGSLNPVATAGHFVDVYGDQIAKTIVENGHTWVQGGDGLFHTNDATLAAEWMGAYSIMQTGTAAQIASLTVIQRMEGNAEVAFLNTALATQSAANIARDREDVQREFDAMAAAMQASGDDFSKPVTAKAYLDMEKAIWTNATLNELADEGHGFNDRPDADEGQPDARYRGYTNDFQNGVDGKTLFIGGGYDNNQNALTNFFDDVILGHAPFPVVWQGGHLEQLNQNGNAEDPLSVTLPAFDDTGYTRVYTAADFSKTASAAHDGYVSPNAAAVAASLVVRNDMHAVPTSDGTIIADTITTTAHVWVANAYGLFQTATDLAAEWKADYTIMQSGNQAAINAMTPLARLEGNAEAVFLNTGLNTLNAATQARDRMDAQREFDAIWAAMKIDATTDGINPNVALTLNAYIDIGRTIQGSPVLEELALQGHGLNSPPAVRYRGYTNDFQNNVDNTTLFVGGGLDRNETAIANLFDDAIMTHTPFAVVWQNGALTQLNQNAAAKSTVETAIVAMDDTMFGRVYTAADFSKTAAAGIDTYVSPYQASVHASMEPVAPAGKIATLYGDIISTTIAGSTANFAGNIDLTPHSWTADSTGLFTTDAGALAQEWTGIYAIMTGGNQAAINGLTAWQRLEGNAEAVFLNTGINSKSLLLQNQYREDVQRSIDVIAAAMKLDQHTLGIPATMPFNLNSYTDLEHTIMGNAVLQELDLQGHGLNSPPASRYRGYTNDIQNKVGGTSYVGGGVNTNTNAVASFMDDSIMTHTGFATVWRNGHLVQLNQNGKAEGSVANAISEINASMFGKTLKAGDFKKA